MNNYQSDDDFDLNKIRRILLRRWQWVIAGGSIGILGAISFNIFAKPLWRGNFQIVLASNDNNGGAMSSLLGGNPMLAQLAGIAGADASSELETEVKILESPLVLKPVFEFVKSYHSTFRKSAGTLQFETWTRKNLEIKLAKGTTVLNINYTDKDPSLILPVLNRISSAYQKYSGRDRIDAIDRGVTYLSAQVSRFQKVADASNRAVDAYAIKYGISTKGNSITSAGLDLSSLLNSQSNRQQQRQANALLNLGANASGSSGSSSIVNQGDALGQLASINQELIRRQQIFTDRDPTLKALVQERNALRKYIETTAGGNLALPSSTSLRKEQAQDIMLRYQELDRIAKRNTATRDSLERSLLSLELEQVRATKPWELISEPQMGKDPVFPRPDLNLALGLLAGLFFGSVTALAIDRRSQVVFEIKELKELLPYPELTTLQRRDIQTWTESLNLIAQGPLSTAGQVAFIPAGTIGCADQLAAELQKALQILDPAAQVIVTRDLSLAKRFSAQLLFAGPGSSNRDDLKRLVKNLELQGKPLVGLLLIDDAA